jgi:hypothetical protein
MKPLEMGAVGIIPAAVVPFVMPWYAYVVLGLTSLLAYAMRQYVLLRLGNKAIERVTPTAVPEVVAALTGASSPRSIPRRAPPGGRGRRRQDEPPGTGTSG